MATKEKEVKRDKDTNKLPMFYTKLLAKRRHIK